MALDRLGNGRLTTRRGPRDAREGLPVGDGRLIAVDRFLGPIGKFDAYIRDGIVAGKLD